MEVLKRLENKIQALVANRNQLLEDLGRTEALLRERDREIQQVKSDLEGAQSKVAALAKEREEVTQEIESLVHRLEAQIEAQQ